VLHTRVADHNEVPGLGIGAGGAVDHCGQDPIDELVRDILIGEVADRTLVAKQLMHVGDRLHRAPHVEPRWVSPASTSRVASGRRWAYFHITRDHHRRWQPACGISGRGGGRTPPQRPRPHHRRRPRWAPGTASHAPPAPGLSAGLAPSPDPAPPVLCPTWT